MSKMKMLIDLYDAGRRLRMTAPVDDDFPEMMHNFDSALKATKQYLEGDRESLSSTLNQSSVVQEWVSSLTMMQQTVLLTAVRGPDGVAKYDPCKFLIRWYRRCILLSAMDKTVWTDPYNSGGGSFTGPSIEKDKMLVEDDWELDMAHVVADYIRAVDYLPHHFQLHFMHASEILGYKHPDARIRDWWNKFYLDLVSDMHLTPEPESEMDTRLSDSRDEWLKRSHPATID